MDKNKVDNYILGHPKPLLSLSLVELWERFSYYGIRPLLILYMTAIVMNGGLNMKVEIAAAIVGIFGGFAYLLPIFGGYLADSWLGQKRATFIGAVIIALGHLSIALSYFYLAFFFIGLVLIASGTGLFKTCSSVMVGMLYKEGDSRRDSGFTIFYMGINLGALIAPLLTGLASQHSWHLGFGIGGVGMLIALVTFYFKTLKDFDEFDRLFKMKSFDTPTLKSYTPIYLAILYVAVVVLLVALQLFGLININPVAVVKYMAYLIGTFFVIYFSALIIREKNSEYRKDLFVILILLVAAAIFWSTFEQQGIAFNLFAEKYTDRNVLGFVIPTAWFQSINPLVVITFAPIVGYIWIALARANMEISSFAKFGLGLIFAGVGYVIMYFSTKILLSGGNITLVSPLWLVFTWFFITIGELCLSPIGLSVMTKIAPKPIRGQIMGMWFIASSFGTLIAGILGGEFQDDRLEALPDLFTHIYMTLFIAAAVLFFLMFVVMRKRSA